MIFIATINVQFGVSAIFFAILSVKTVVGSGEIHHIDPWGPCSATCGAGVQTQKIWKCVDLPDKPPCARAVAKTQFRACNMQLCPGCTPALEHGEWTPCSVSCGPGQRQRNIYQIMTGKSINWKEQAFTEVSSCDTGPCPNINECASSPCTNGANCTDNVNSYKCTCQAGYTGTDCQTNINECASSPCQNRGNCTDTINGYNCTCSPGFIGNNCQTFNVTINITVDDVYVLYVDGMLEGSGNNWGIIGRYTVPSTACLLAVDATNTGGQWGIRVNSSIISTATLSSWKCVPANQVIGTSWIQTPYNDSSWPSAVVGNTVFTPTIWAAVNITKVYCRGRTALCQT